MNAKPLAAITALSMAIAPGLAGVASAERREGYPGPANPAQEFSPPEAPQLPSADQQAVPASEQWAIASSSSNTRAVGNVALVSSEASAATGDSPSLTPEQIAENCRKTGLEIPGNPFLGSSIAHRNGGRVITLRVQLGDKQPDPGSPDASCGPGEGLPQTESRDFSIWLQRTTTANRSHRAATRQDSTKRHLNLPDDGQAYEMSDEMRLKGQEPLNKGDKEKIVVKETYHDRDLGDISCTTTFLAHPSPAGPSKTTCTKKF